MQSCRAEVHAGSYQGRAGRRLDGRQSPQRDRGGHASSQILMTSTQATASPSSWPDLAEPTGSSFNQSLPRTNAACRHSLPEFKAVAAVKGEICVSLYVPTETARERERQNRIAFKDQAAQALQQLKGRQAPHRAARTAISLSDRRRQGLYGRRQDQEAAEQAARPDRRVLEIPGKRPRRPRDADYDAHLPHAISPQAAGRDRRPFHLTPLIRVTTSPQDIYVLALTEKEVRLVRAFVDLPPMRITIPDLPNNVEEVARRASIRERNQKAACKARKPPNSCCTNSRAGAIRRCMACRWASRRRWSPPRTSRWPRCSGRSTPIRA
jgi:hypothetical protein